MTIKIRPTTETDSQEIQALHLAAFSEEENDIVAQLAVDLVHTESTPACLSLVAESKQKIMGHIVFSPMTSTIEDLNIYNLAPLGVLPQAQRSGIGRQLIESGLEQLMQTDCQVVIVYGDPAYYGRYGFDEALAKSFIPPFPLQFPFGWQALALRPVSDIAAPTHVQCVAALNKPELW